MGHLSGSFRHLDIDDLTRRLQRQQRQVESGVRADREALRKLRDGLDQLRRRSRTDRYAVDLGSSGDTSRFPTVYWPSNRTYLDVDASGSMGGELFRKWNVPIEAQILPATDWASNTFTGMVAIDFSNDIQVKNNAVLVVPRPWIEFAPDDTGFTAGEYTIRDWAIAVDYGVIDSTWTPSTATSVSVGTHTRIKLLHNDPNVGHANAPTEQTRHHFNRNSGVYTGAYNSLWAWLFLDDDTWIQSAANSAYGLAVGFHMTITLDVIPVGWNRTASFNLRSNSTPYVIEFDTELEQGFSDYVT